MSTKKQNKTAGEQQGPGKIKRLNLNKQTVRDLSVENSGKVKGGRQIADTPAGCANTLADSVCVCVAPRR
jgi:hypothetical protein